MCSLSSFPTHNESYLDWMLVLLLLIRIGIPGDMIHSCRFLFMNSNSIYLNVLSFTLASQAILPVLASPPGTIPTDLSTTLSRPDLVLISNDSIHLFELTIPTNTQQHLLAARAQKKDQYGSFITSNILG